MNEFKILDAVKLKLMKRILSVLLFLFCISSFAQSYSEKYNSLLKRYEYYNTQGNLVGYKTYDNLNRQWNYTDLSQSAQTYTPTSSINLPLIQQVLATKNKQYEVNSNSINNQIDHIRSFFDYFQMYSKYPQVNFFLVDIMIVMKEYSNILNKYSGADLSSSIAQQFKNELKDIIRQLSNINEKVKHYERDPNYYTTNTTSTKTVQTVYVKGMGIIWDNSDFRTAKNIGFVSESQVTIIEKTNNDFYKVQYGKIIGYMTATSLFQK